MRTKPGTFRVHADHPRSFGTSGVDARTSSELASKRAATSTRSDAGLAHPLGVEPLE